jgi:surfeit locus 1 family protein
MIRRVLVALAVLAGVVLLASLGVWQWGRGQQRTALHDAQVAQENAAPIVARELIAARADDTTLLHRPVAVRGQWLGGRTIFLDNRQMNGVPGFYVVTPLRLEGSQAVVLVQRGWVQRNFTRREDLPEIQNPPGIVEVRGRLAPPPAKLYAFDAQESGPIRQNLDLNRFRIETGLPLLPLSVQQTGPASEGLLRQWPQAGSGAEKNFGYAFQWWAMAATLAILYVWFQFIQPRRQDQHP